MYFLWVRQRVIDNRTVSCHYRIHRPFGTEMVSPSPALFKRGTSQGQVLPHLPPAPNTIHEHPEVAPQVLHLRQVPLRTSV